MNEIETLRYQLMRNGIIGYSYSDLEYLLKVAKICAAQGGIPLAGVGAVGLAGAGSVMIPVVGAIPGWVAGALAGFVGGTVTCTMGRMALKPELDRILSD